MERELVMQYFDESWAQYEPRIADGIERNRKGDASLPARLDGKAVPDGTKVTVELTDHEFRFGANLFMLDELETPEKNAIYRRKFPELFNLATVPFYWSDLEPEEGKPRYAKDSPKVYRRPAPDLCLEYCEANGIEPKCHCLNYDNFLPLWLYGKDTETDKRYLIKRFAEIAQRYRDRIPSFEVTNETLKELHHSPFFLEDDFVEWSFREADKYFPDKRLIINDYIIFSPSVSSNRNAYYMQIKRLRDNGIRHLDSIGFQFHSFFYPEQAPKLVKERYNPEKLFQLMDLFGRFGIREQITEMTIPAYTGEAEDEAIQAELLEKLYRIFFSHPKMEAIIYWNLVDGYAAWAEPGDMSTGENQYRGGLLRFDMSEKPAYQTLKRLIRDEWHTKTECTVQNGTLGFRGFYGDYRITYHLPQGDREVSFTLSSEANGGARHDACEH